jgi:hypothetical protein
VPRMHLQYIDRVEKTGDHRASQRSLAHVSDRLIVNHIIAVAGTQHLKEVQAALGARGANQVKWSLLICAQKPLVALWRAPVSSTVIQSALDSGTKHVASLGEEFVLPGVQLAD